VELPNWYAYVLLMQLFFFMSNCLLFLGSYLHWHYFVGSPGGIGNIAFVGDRVFAVIYRPLHEPPFLLVSWPPMTPLLGDWKGSDVHTSFLYQ